MLIPGMTLAADDLTGAAEVAAGAARAWEARLLDWRHVSDQLPPAAGVAVSINTGSRHLPVDQAVARLRSLMDGLSGDAWFYKKCDSTLRGPIAAEVQAVRERFADRPLWYIGAAPGAGRTVREGKVFVHGEPVAATDFARDPLFPVTTSELPRLLAETGLSVSLWQPGQREVELADVIVADGQTMEDFESLVAHLLQLPVPPVLAGAGAFIPFLPELMGASTGEIPTGLTIELPCLILNGSLHPAGLSQVQIAEAAGVPAIVLAPDCFFGAKASSRLAAQVEVARKLMDQGLSLIVRTAAVAGEALAYRAAAEAAGVSGAAIHEVVTGTLARFGSELMEQANPPALISFGGELAEQLWEKLEIQEARMLGFAQEHLAVTEAVTGTKQRFVWATKPGGFGQANLLIELLHA